MFIKNLLRIRRERVTFFLLFILLFLCLFPLKAQAARLDGNGEQIYEGPYEELPEPVQDEAAFQLGDFDFKEIQKVLNGSAAEGTETISFEGLLKELLAGNFTGAFTSCLSALKNSLFGEIAANGRWMGQVMILGLIGAVFANFASIFSGSQISETGFYVTYLLLFTFLASSFFSCMEITKEVFASIIEFMRALTPAYFLSVSFSGGSLSSAAGYGWMLFSISALEWLTSVFFLPMVRIYTLFVLAGHMMKENIFSKMTELIETGIKWGLKTTVGIVLGFHLLQSMVTPYADSLKNTSVQRVISMIPGVGQGAAAVSQLVMGSGVLIKNTIGAGAVIVLIIICAVPLMKLAVMLLFYRGTAAILQPVCDKRMISCISAVGNACQLLLRMVMTSFILFAVSIGVICMAANVTYYAG